MGCDVHAHVEQKVDGKWIHYTKLRIARSYELFRHLTGNGVRPDPAPNDYPIGGLRGLPEGISYPTKLDYGEWESDAHSESWLTGEEMDGVSKLVAGGERRYPPDFDYFYGNNHGSDYPKFVEDVRLVFWFDN